MSNATPKLIIIRGTPGAGKSYLAVGLQAKLGADHVAILDPDAVDKNADDYVTLAEGLKADGVDEKFYPFRYLRAKAHEAVLAGKTIVWNQAFNDFAGFKITVDKLVEYAAEQGLELPVLVAEVTVGRAIARARIDERTHRGGHAVSDERLDKFFAEYQSFAGKEYRTISIDGEVDISVSVEQVLAAL